MERARITVFDTTLRDGEQSPGCSMNVQEKLRLAHQLDRLGVDVIEAGFPIASEGDFEAVQAIAATVRRPDHRRRWRGPARPTSSARGRPSREPRVRAFTCSWPLPIFICSTSCKISRQQCLEQARDAVRLAKSLCEDVEFSPEDATRTDPDFLCQVLKAVVEAGATTLNIPDTVGYSMPAEFGELIQTHPTASAGHRECDHLGALPQRSGTGGGEFAGRDRRGGAAGGVHDQRHRRARGQCFAGRNCDGDAGAARPVSRMKPAIVSEQLFPASQMLSEITGVPVQPNKAIIGRNAFAHEAGIHQDGMLKNPLTYEIMTPQSVGVPDSQAGAGQALRTACAEPALRAAGISSSIAASWTMSIAVLWCWRTRSSTWRIITCWS